MFRLWPFFVWLAYLILPYDLIPDFLLGFGWSEDLLILAAIYWWWRKRQQASASESPNYRARQQDAAGAGEQAGGQSGSRQQGGDRADSRQQTRDPYKILGITRPARLEQIKHAYRLQASRYHPDKVSHLGVEFQTLAKEKFQDIQWAYEQLLQEHRA